MPILKLHCENIGPFDKLELDLTDGKGNAHLGPHILAGVNGSGKTTVLRAIAWCLNTKESGFDREHWNEFLEGQPLPRALLVPASFGSRKEEYPYRALGKSNNPRAIDQASVDWASRTVRGPIVAATRTTDPHTAVTEVTSLAAEAVQALGCVAAYAPGQRLRLLHSAPSADGLATRGKALSFEDTVANEAVQTYWVHAFSREALTRSHGRENRSAAKAVSDLQAALKQILDLGVVPSVNLEGPFIQPTVRFRGTELNFSQLPAGVNTTIGWVVDYLLRRESFAWSSDSMAAERPGVILIDEIETHLHPQWQRRILSGMRAAFPNTQIIVTTHSPFVVSSCKDARVHLLKLNEKGKAYLAETVDDPDGVSVAATIKGVFEVASQFGPEIEAELKVWNDLKKREAVGKLAAKEKAALRTLTDRIAARGEELASLVHEPAVSRSIIEELIETASKHR